MDKSNPDATKVLEDSTIIGFRAWLVQTLGILFLG